MVSAIINSEMQISHLLEIVYGYFSNRWTIRFI